MFSGDVINLYNKLPMVGLDSASPEIFKSTLNTFLEDLCSTNTKSEAQERGI